MPNSTCMLFKIHAEYFVDLSFLQFTSFHSSVVRGGDDRPYFLQGQMNVLLAMSIGPKHLSHIY